MEVRRNGHLSTWITPASAAPQRKKGEKTREKLGPALSPEFCGRRFSVEKPSLPGFGKSIEAMQTTADMLMQGIRHAPRGSKLEKDLQERCYEYLAVVAKMSAEIALSAQGQEKHT